MRMCFYMGSVVGVAFRQALDGKLNFLFIFFIYCSVTLCLHIFHINYLCFVACSLLLMMVGGLTIFFCIFFFNFFFVQIVRLRFVLHRTHFYIARPHSNRCSFSLFVCVVILFVFIYS